MNHKQYDKVDIWETCELILISEIEIADSK